MLKTQVKKWLKENKIEGKIEHPANERFGDFAVRSGRKIEIGNEDLIEKIENVSGFTNIFLSQKSLIKEAEKIINGKLLEELMMEGKGKKMVIDYSSPNIAKAFGIGHLRSTNIGQAIYNIYKILGWECIGENHLGDWGTQFGKLIVSIKKWGPSTMSEIKKLKIGEKFCFIIAGVCNTPLHFIRSFAYHCALHLFIYRLRVTDYELRASKATALIPSLKIRSSLVIFSLGRVSIFCPPAFSNSERGANFSFKSLANWGTW